MTTEIGPRDDDADDLDVFERLAARSTSLFVDVLVAMYPGKGSLRFNADTATLSIGGESERHGDAFARGQLVASLLMANALLPVGALILLGDVMNAAGPSLALVIMAPFTALALFSMMMLTGSMGLFDKVDVIDHTTAPAPDAIDDLEAAYLADKIDEEELGERAAEVWADE